MCDVMLVQMLHRLAQQEHHTPHLRLGRTCFRCREGTEIAIHQRHHQEMARRVVDRHEGRVHRQEAEQRAFAVGSLENLSDVVARDARLGRETCGHDSVLMLRGHDVEMMLLVLLLFLLCKGSSGRDTSREEGDVTAVVDAVVLHNADDAS